MADTHTHTHGPGTEHAHPGATAGHTHDPRTTAPPPGRPVGPTTAPAYGTTPAAAGEAYVHEEHRTTVSPGAFIARLLLTLAGAVALFVGPYMNWLREFEGTRGVDAHVSLFWTPNTSEASTLWVSAGFVFIVLGVLALIGLLPRSGWLTTLSGLLALVGVALIGVTLYRVEEVQLGVEDFGPGLWLIAAGGLVLFIAGFIGRRRDVVVREREVVR